MQIDIISLISIGVLLLIGIPVSVIDVKTKKISGIWIIFGIIFSFILMLFSYESILSIGFWCLDGFIPFCLLFLTYLLTKKKMGFGDVKYSFFLGSIAGVKEWLMGTTLLCLFLIIMVLFLLLIKKINNNTKIPFAPFLTAGAFTGILLGPIL